MNINDSDMMDLQLNTSHTDSTCALFLPTVTERCVSQMLSHLSVPTVHWYHFISSRLLLITVKN